VDFRTDDVRDEDISLELTPLIDMMFQLLIFFLLTTTFAINVKEGGIEVEVPRAKSAQISSMAKQVVIAITKDGRTVVGNEVLNDKSLRSKLEEIKEENPKIMVVIQADRAVEHWLVVKVMDMAAEIGLQRIGIATVEE
jgi:biopolymer transport protein ExbD